MPTTAASGKLDASSLAATPAPQPTSTMRPPRERKRSVTPSKAARTTGTRKLSWRAADMAHCMWQVWSPCSAQVIPTPVRNASAVRSISRCVMGGPNTPGI